MARRPHTARRFLRELLAAAIALVLVGVPAPFAAAQSPQTIPAGATTQVALGNSEIVATCTPPAFFQPNPTEWHANPSSVLTAVTTEADASGAGYVLGVTVPAGFPPQQSITISWNGNSSCVSFRGSVTLTVCSPGACPAGTSGTGASPSQNACLQKNAWGLDPAQRRQLDAWEMELRKAAKQLADAAKVFDVFWYLELTEKKFAGQGETLSERLADAMERVESHLDQAEAAVGVAQLDVLRLQRAVAKTKAAQKLVHPKSKKGKALKRQLTEQKQQLKAAEQVLSDGRAALRQFNRSRAGELARALRDYPKLRQVALALRAVEKYRGQIDDFFEKNPSAKALARRLSVIGLAGDLATYGAWSAELLANLFRELRKPPLGCQQLFEQAPPTAMSAAAAPPPYTPAFVAPVNLPRAIAGRLPAAAVSLRSDLAELSAVLPAVQSGLQRRDRDTAARQALESTLPRLRKLLQKTAALRRRAVGALDVAGRVVDPARLAGYKRQAPSRAAVRVLRKGGAPRSLIESFTGGGAKAAGSQDPLTQLATPALDGIYAGAAAMLASVR